MDLTVCVVNYYSAGYIKFLDSTMRRLADHQDFAWLICNGQSDDRESHELADLPKARVLEQDLSNLFGSLAHGTGLNALVPHIKTEFALFIDPDSALLAKGWDTICEHALQEDVAAIGAPYGAVMSRHRYGDFPAIFFLFCRTEFVQANKIDLRPGWATRFGSWRRSFRRWVGLFDSDQDTGWKVRQAAHRRGLNGICFRWLNSASADSVLFRNEERGDEYHWQGSPIWSHQGRTGARRPFQGKESVAWFLAICRFLDIDPLTIDGNLRLNVNFPCLDRGGTALGAPNG